jgi:hypothetical protein
MKKAVLLLFCLLSAIYTGKSQELLISGTASYFSMSPHPGFGFGMTMSQFYFDFSGNWAKGTGVSSDFVAVNSYLLDEKNIIVVNVGYHIPYRRKFLITPFAGIGALRQIYEAADENSYSYGQAKAKLSVGVNGTFRFSRYVGVSLGCGTLEYVKAGIVIGVWGR